MTHLIEQANKRVLSEAELNEHILTTQWQKQTREKAEQCIKM